MFNILIYIIMWSRKNLINVEEMTRTAIVITFINHFLCRIHLQKYTYLTLLQVHLSIKIYQSSPCSNYGHYEFKLYTPNIVLFLYSWFCRYVGLWSTALINYDMKAK